MCFIAPNPDRAKLTAPSIAERHAPSAAQAQIAAEKVKKLRQIVNSGDMQKLSDAGPARAAPKNRRLMHRGTELENVGPIGPVMPEPIGARENRTRTVQFDRDCDNDHQRGGKHNENAGDSSHQVLCATEKHSDLWNPPDLRRFPTGQRFTASAEAASDIYGYREISPGTSD